MIQEFLEFSPNSDLHKDLISVIKDNVLEVDNTSLPRELFPVLGGLKSNGNINMNSNWVNNNNNNNNTTTRRTNSPSIINEKFPALAKPTKKNFVNPNSQPIRYTTILKPQPKSNFDEYISNIK